MAVTSVKLDAGAWIEAVKGKRTGERVYTVQTNSATADDPATVRTAVDPNTLLRVPLRGDAWSVTELTLLARRIRVQQEGDPLVYRCTVTYETGELINEDENPLLDPPQIEWDFDESREPIYKDRNGVPIQASSRERFDPEVEDDVFDLSVTITRNLESFNVPFANDMVNSVNESTFSVDGYSVPPQTSFLAGFRSSKAFRNGIHYRVVTTRLRFRVDGWKRNFLDQGYTEFIDGKNRVIVDAAGLPLNQPVRLDGTGVKLDDASPPVFLTYDIKKLRDFNTLDLP